MNHERRRRRDGGERERERGDGEGGLRSRGASEDYRAPGGEGEAFPALHRLRDLCPP